MGDGGSGEKTEEPTPERLRKLRHEGNVPRSQDVTMAVSFLALFVMIAGLFGYMSGELRDLVHLAFRAAFSSHEPGVAVQRLLLAGLRTMALVSGPILLAAMSIGVAMSLAQVGFLFTVKPITPDLQKINPVQGFKGLFHGKKLVELLKTLSKFAVIVWLSWLALRDALRDVALLVRGELAVGVQVVGAVIWEFTIKIAGAFLLIAAADYLYQRKRYLKDNMMSKYDVKQEYKQSEGDPHYKSERRRVHQEILSSASPAAVKDADVVVCNPDHIAVALKYDKEKGTAPTVVAKGNRVWAEKILEAARHYGVPVVRNVPLAHALDKLEVGDEIPEELYEAVAEVLGFIHSLAEEQKAKAGGHRSRSPAGGRRSAKPGK